MNVKLKPTFGEISLTLDPFKSQISAHQFIGLENLTNFTMGYSTIKLPDDFFTQTPNLRSLDLHGVELPSAGINCLPDTLKSLDLKRQSSATLPETLPELLSEVNHALPNLTHLSVDRWAYETNRQVYTIHKDGSSVLETLRLIQWPETSLAPLERWQCPNLRIFQMKNSQVQHLPERVIAACPRLEELSITISDITSLPAKLLEGASALKRLDLSNGHFQSLPEGLFEGAPNLISIDLSSNGLRSIPRQVPQNNSTSIRSYCFMEKFNET